MIESLQFLVLKAMAEVVVYQGISPFFRHPLQLLRHRHIHDFEGAYFILSGEHCVACEWLEAFRYPKDALRLCASPRPRADDDEGDKSTDLRKRALDVRSTTERAESREKKRRRRGAPLLSWPSSSSCQTATPSPE